MDLGGKGVGEVHTASCLVNHPSQLCFSHVVRLIKQLLTICFLLIKYKQCFYIISCEYKFEKITLHQMRAFYFSSDALKCPY